MSLTVTQSLEGQYSHSSSTKENDRDVKIFMTIYLEIVDTNYYVFKIIYIIS